MIVTPWYNWAIGWAKRGPRTDSIQPIAEADDRLADAVNRRGVTICVSCSASYII